jgi:hypothetical protein
MNERIKELLAQTGTDISGKWISIESAGRFSQLIVEECARICDIVRENEGGDKKFGARLCADEVRYLNRRS